MAVVGGIETLLLGTGAYAADPHLMLDPLQGPSGTTVSAHGTAFCVSCGPVEIDFVARPVKQGITVASDGSFQTTFVVPGGAQGGANAVNAYQQGKLVTQTSFKVTPSSPAPGARRRCARSTSPSYLSNQRAITPKAWSGLKAVRSNALTFKVPKKRSILPFCSGCTG